ncbi:MAG: hypothetical protein H6621_09530 [Halobacteriovoraceae bacterium]|nr:hypothetical protein [Halobacteriovoraceae bacterium]MCB9095297.1 hypothetical protein [Halobacteriovoraceae bacterium]
MKNIFWKISISQVLSSILILSLSFFPSQNYAQDKNQADKIFNLYNNFQSTFILPQANKNFTPDDPHAYDEFLNQIDYKLYQNSENVKALISESYLYLKENYNELPTRESPQYKKVLAIGKKLDKYRQLEIRLRDDNCLNSSNQTVRALSYSILQGSVAAPFLQQSHCVEDDYSTFIQSIDDILDCYVHGREDDCHKPKIYPNGYFGFPKKQKLNLLKDFLAFKKKKDSYMKNLVHYAFTGTCRGDQKQCAEMADLKLPTNPLNDINSKLMQLNADRENIIQEAFKQAPAKYPNRDIRITDDKKLMIERLPYHKTPKEVFNKLAPGATQKFAQDFTKLATTPLKFATQESLELCLPKFYDYIKNPFTSLLDRRRGYLIIKEPQTLTKQQLECLNRKTQSTLDTFGLEVTNKINAYIIAHQYGKEHSEVPLDKGIEKAITEDPIAFGGLLVSQGSSEDFLNICKTIMKVASDLEDRELKFNELFTGINLGALILIGAAAIITGPVSLAVAGLSIGLSVTDGITYSYRQNQFAKEVSKAQVNGMQMGVHVDDEKVAREIFERTMNEALELKDQEASARFWKYFAFIGAGINTIAGAAAVMSSAKIAYDSSHITKLGKLLLKIFVRGGTQAQNLSKSMASLSEIGDDAIIGLSKAVSTTKERSRFMQYLKERGLIDKIHKSVQRMQKVAEPISNTSSAYWAQNYSEQTLLAIGRVLLQLPAFDITSQEANYSDLSLYLTEDNKQ